MGTRDLSLKGKCGDEFSIPGLSQLIYTMQKSGDLSLWQIDSLKAHVQFHQGVMVGGQLGRLQGIDVLGHAVCWQYGRGGFEFQKGTVGDPPEHNPFGGETADQVLLRVMQRVDECPFRARLREFLGRITQELALMPGIEWNQELLRASPPLRRLVELFAGHESLPAAYVLTHLQGGEIASCEAFSAALDQEAVVLAALLRAQLPYDFLLQLVNLLARYGGSSEQVLELLHANGDLLGIPEVERITAVGPLRLVSLARFQFTQRAPQRAEVFLQMARHARRAIEQAAAQGTAAL
ncbi:MAG TPA: DUF4388 domain-containing protein [Acidobacteriota bacterium]